MNLRMVLFTAALTLIGMICLPSCSPTPPATPTATATPAADPVRGEEIFTKGVNESPPCISCHQVSDNSSFGFALGPNLIGIGNRASTRITDMSAEDYLANSILEPAAFIVPGYRNIMYPKFADHFSEQDVADLIAYMMTL
jgi:mono/diheme cytochrome c family protein